jgi:uncharacterized protein (DUF58 family)
MSVHGVSVLPNRHTVGLCALLAAMCYAGAGQNNGVAYLLCFTIAGLALVSVLHAWANLRSARLSAGSIRPVFAGETLLVPLLAETRPGSRNIAAFAWTRGAPEAAFPSEITAQNPQAAELRIATSRRGRYDRLEVELRSAFPLGFFTARRKFVLAQTWFVYPRPDGHRPLPVEFSSARERSSGARGEGDDFAGLREWRAGESMRHVDWKAAARGQRLLIKQWTGIAGDLLTLDWGSLPELGLEARLSQLTRWAILAEQGGATYGLSLPGARLEPARGEAHFHACLRALAVFQSAGETHPEAISGKQG